MMKLKSLTKYGGIVSELTRYSDSHILNLISGKQFNRDWTQQTVFKIKFQEEVKKQVKDSILFEDTFHCSVKFI